MTGRVMGIALHPFLIGHPHRARHFAAALAHIAAHDEVWLATGSEIADWYRTNYRRALSTRSRKPGRNPPG